MDSLAELKNISDQNKINGSIARAMDDVSTLLDGGLAQMESLLRKSLDDAPAQIDKICKHIIEAGGKRIRPSICMLSNRAAGGLGQLPVNLSIAGELLHNATLLHDDVIDEGDVRRGRPAARMVWSNALSILGGDYMLMRCVELVSKLGSQYMSVLTGTLKSLVEGEVVQLGLRGSLDTTTDDYFKIVTGKTSSLFAFAAATGALSADGNPDDCHNLGEFGKSVGVAFQLIDDALDFSADSAVLGKNLLADVSQGKLTLPVIIASKQNNKIKPLLTRLLSSGDSREFAPEISSLILSTDAIEQVKKQASQYTKLALEHLGRVKNGNSDVVNVMEQLTLALLSRNS